MQLIISFCPQLKASVPDDVLEIIAKDNSRRCEIRRKGERDAQSPDALHCCSFSTTSVEPLSLDSSAPTDSGSHVEFQQTLRNLRNFHAAFKVRSSSSYHFHCSVFYNYAQLKSRVPEDILPILTKDVGKQNSLRKKATIDAQLPSARTIYHNLDTSCSKASDILEGNPMSRKAGGNRRPTERSLTMNMTLTEVKRLIERGFQGPAVSDHLSPFARSDMNQSVSDEQPRLAAARQLFESLVCLDEKGVQAVFSKLQPEDLKVVADIAQFVCH